MKIYPEIPITGKLQQLLIGSLLGDGSFVSNGGHTKNCYLSIAHCIKQKEYLEFKTNILKEYNLAAPIRYIITKNNRYIKGYVLLE